MTPDGVLGWGIIGIGNIVQTTIAPAMVCERSCDVVAGVSRDQDRADAFAHQFGARYAYTSYEEMLANSEVEAVFIATPNDQHAAQVVAAAHAGKHVLCDKPLATNLADAKAATDACARAGVHLGINFHNRYLPWVGEVRRLIAADAIGSVEAISAEVGSGPRNYTNWRADPAAAGMGSVFNVGVHVLDFIGWVLGSQPVEVTAMFTGTPVEMMAMIQLRYGNGALVHVNCNERLRAPRNDIVIHGTKGRIVGRNLTRSRSDGSLHVEIDGSETISAYPAPEAHRLCVAGFAAAVVAGRSPEPSGGDGLRSVALCDAIGRSVAERRVVDIEEFV